jgi:hypothetical protein
MRVMPTISGYVAKNKTGNKRRRDSIHGGTWPRTSRKVRRLSPINRRRVAVCALNASLRV